MPHTLLFPELPDWSTYQTGDLLRTRMDIIYLLLRLTMDKTNSWVAVNLASGVQWTTPQSSIEKAIVGMDVIDYFRDAKITIKR